MTAVSDIPINTWCWGLGSVVLVVLGLRSVVGYRKTRGQLTKYMVWFSLAFLPCLMFFSVPALFSLDHGVLLTTSIIGEFFFWAGLVTQAAILWCLVLRRYFSIYYAIVPVAAIALVCWLYDAPRSWLFLSHGFINYYDPRVTSFVIAVMMAGLFVPVGLYFIHAVSGQTGLKAKVTSFALGLMYVGIGLSAASEEVFARQLITSASAVFNLFIAAIVLVALVLPWRLSVRLPAQVQAPAPPKPM